MSAKLSDQELLPRLLGGDEQAFRLIVRAYHQQLLRLARNFVGSAGVAEEVVQETWVAVLEGLPKFEGRSSLKTWIFRILSNRAKTRGVREGRVVSFTDVARADQPAVESDRFDKRGHWLRGPSEWEEGLAEAILHRQGLVQLVQREIEKLPANQSAVITLRDVQGFTSQEVCELLEVSEGNQRVLLHRGRAKIRAALERHLAADEAAFSASSGDSVTPEVVGETRP